MDKPIKLLSTKWDKTLTLHTILITAFILLMVSTASHAEIYKWTDEAGQTHYGDAPKTKQAVETIAPKINSYKPVVAPELIPIANSNQTRPKSKKVVMYSTAWCGYCKKARHYFNANNIPFSEYDIEKSNRANRNYRKQGGTGSVPLIIVGKKKMRGFSVAGFNNIYP